MLLLLLLLGPRLLAVMALIMLQAMMRVLHSCCASG
jgi:hypothetical protein